MTVDMTVDAAREALQAAIVTDATARQVIEAIDAFEAAVRAECETAEGRLLDEALSTLRAGTLDVERLARALHLYMCALPDSPHTLQPDRDTRRAELVAAEYARLEAADKS